LRDLYPEKFREAGQLANESQNQSQTKNVLTRARQIRDSKSEQYYVKIQKAFLEQKEKTFF
jgi:hypothetical protein